MKILAVLFIVLITGCAGGAGMNVYDGTWSMCKYQNSDGSFAMVPTPTGGLPVGGGDGKGNEVVCTPIPARPTPVDGSVEKA
jgi:hypothetical protein